MLGAVGERVGAAVEEGAGDFGEQDVADEMGLQFCIPWQKSGDRNQPLYPQPGVENPACPGPVAFKKCLAELHTFRFSKKGQQVFVSTSLMIILAAFFYIFQQVINFCLASAHHLI